MFILLIPSELLVDLSGQPIQLRLNFGLMPLRDVHCQSGNPLYSWHSHFSNNHFAFNKFFVKNLYQQHQFLILLVFQLILLRV